MFEHGFDQLIIGADTGFLIKIEQVGQSKRQFFQALPSISAVLFWVAGFLK